MKNTCTISHTLAILVTDVDGLAQLPPLGQSGLHREIKNKGWLAAPAIKHI